MEESCKDCAFLLNLNAHPCNGNNKAYGWLEDPIKFGKGRVDEQIGYVCGLSFIMKEKREEASLTFFDFNNGLCEMFTDRSKNELTISITSIK